MPPKRDVSKLPRWAQSRIEVLERNLRESEERMEKLVAQEPTRVLVDKRYSSKGLYLPDNSYVRFFCGPDPAKEDRWNPSLEVNMMQEDDANGTIRLYAPSGHRLKAMGQSSNVLYLGFQTDLDNYMSPEAT